MVWLLSKLVPGSLISFALFFYFDLTQYWLFVGVTDALNCDEWANINRSTLILSPRVFIYVLLMK